MRVIAIAAVAALVLNSAGAAIAQKPLLEGAWRLTSIAPAGRQAISAPQPGLYIFTSRHYSIVQVEGDKPRPSLPEDFRTGSAQAVLAVFGSPFTAHSGTYTVSGATLALRPIVAKHPYQMQPEFVAELSFQVSNDALSLKLMRTSADPSPQQVTYTLKRAE